MGAVRFPVMMVISAVDDVTARSKKINQSLHRQFEPLTSLGTSLRGLGVAAGLDHLRHELGEVGHSVNELWASSKESLLRLVELPGIGAAALFELVHSYAEGAVSAKLFADKTGMSVEAVQELRFAAKLAHVEQDALDTGVLRLSRNLGMIAHGGGAQAIAALDRLEISATDSEGRLKSVSVLLPELADKLSMVKDESLVNADVFALLGRGGAALIPLLKKGSRGINEYVAEARRLGVVIGEHDVEAAEEFEHSLHLVEGALQGVRNKVGRALLPAIDGVLVRFEEWIEHKGPAIERWAKRFAEDLPGRIDALVTKFDAWWDSIKPVRDVLGAVVERVGAFNVVAGTMAVLIFGPVVSSSWAMVSAMWAVGVTLVTRTIPSVWAFFASLLATDGALVQFAVTAALRATPAMWEFTAAVLANPLTWFGVLIGAIVAGLVLLGYELHELYTLIKPIWPELKHALSNAAEYYVAVIKEKILEPIQWIVDAWTVVKTFFAELWDGISDRASKALDFVLDKVRSVVNLLPDWAKGALGVNVSSSSTSEPAPLAPSGRSLLERATITDARPGDRAQPGDVRVRVAFDNAPAGTKVVTEKAAGADVQLSLGYMMRAP